MISVKLLNVDNSDNIIWFLSFMPQADQERVILKINQKYHYEIKEYNISTMKDKLISNGINIDFEWEYPIGQDLYCEKKFENIDEFITFVNIANAKVNKKKNIKNAYIRMCLRNGCM